MKNKKKMIAMVEIAIVLCLVFLVALPATAIAAEQTTQNANANTITTASEDDYVLGVYGNANEDDTIDMRDMTYVKLIFFGKKPETELSDAKYDGKINPLDFIQIKLIIVGKEKELTIIDAAERVVTVSMPVERSVVFSLWVVETMRSIKATDSIVGVNLYTIGKEIFFPEFSDYPNVGSLWSPDIEQILSLHPDIVFLSARYSALSDEIQNTLESADPDITMVRFDCVMPQNYVDEARKLGYILGKMEEADELIDFYSGVIDTIKEGVEVIPEDDKTRVYFELFKPYNTFGESSMQDKVEMAGGKNIFSDLSGYVDVDPESVITRNPEVIVMNAYPEGGYVTDDITKLSDMRNEIMNRPELADVTAVKNDRFFVIFNDLIGGRYFVGIGYMAKWFYPDLFENLDPKATHQEYLTRFQGLDYDLDKHGVFVYPEPS